jgi:hypothetical protein
VARRIPVADFYHSLGLPQRSAGYPRSALSTETGVGLTLMNTTSIAPAPRFTPPSQGKTRCQPANTPFSRLA